MQTIVEFRKKLTEYVSVLRDNQNEGGLLQFCAVRGFDIDLIKNLGIFYIEKNVEMLVPQYFEYLKDFGVISITNGKPIYSERIVIPIYDMDGLVMGMVGYSLTSKERYMYATTKYFNRNDILYGMERYKKCIKDGYVIVTEGITDCIRILNLGFENCMSTAGAHRSLFMMMVLDIIPIVLFIPDRDRAGDGTKDYWKTNNYGRLLIPFMYKDVDEYARNSEISTQNLKEHIELALEYMKNALDKGQIICGEEMPIYAE